MVHHSSNDKPLTDRTRYSSYARFCSMHKVAAVTWCAYLVLVTCAPDSMASARPDVVSSDRNSAVVHPLSRSQSPNNFSRFISMCKPPIMTTMLFSRCISGKHHCICFTMAYNGWSATITGVYVGFKCFTPFLMTSMACLIIHVV